VVYYKKKVDIIYCMNTIIDDNPDLSVLGFASLITDRFTAKGPEVIPSTADVPQVLELISQSPRAQEAWSRAYVGIKRFPEKRQELLSGLDAKLTNLGAETPTGKLEPSQANGALMGIGLILGGLGEMKENNLVLPEKIETAQNAIMDLSDVARIILAHTE
jgi:hypothetical protein